jgi:beta-N-acetylhexosaminidase
MTYSLSVQVGQLLFVGFQAQNPGPDLRELIATGERGGIIRFKRNIPAAVVDLAHHNAELAALAPPDLPLLIAVDQEGGRVARIGAPLLHVPAARVLARGGEALIERTAYAQSAQLLALGFGMNFAPVLDVDDEPLNPIIGDRAFGNDADAVARYALAFAAGMRRAGLLACGKHAPGHGNTRTDSHLELPHVAAPLSKLEQVEFPPFVRAVAAHIDSLMTAHIVYTALDSATCATMSNAIIDGLLRTRWGYTGVIFSDDLEMKAIRDPASAAVAAIRAGVDGLLVCSDAEVASEVHTTLVREAEREPEFARQIATAFARIQVLKRRISARASADAFVDLVEQARPLAAELAALA